MITVTAQAVKSCCRKKSWDGTPEEENLEASSENRHRGCGRDTLWCI